MSTRTELPGGWYAEHRDEGIAIGHRDGGLHMAGLFEVSMVHEIERLRAALTEARRWIGDGDLSDGLAAEHWTPFYRAAVEMVDAALKEQGK